MAYEIVPEYDWGGKNAVFSKSSETHGNLRGQCHVSEIAGLLEALLRDHES